TNTRNTTTYGASRMNPQVCQGDMRLRTGPEGAAGSICGSASVDMSENLGKTSYGHGGGAAAPVFRSPKLTGYFFYPGNHFIHRLVYRHFFAEDAIHRLRPHVLVVEDGELVVL